MRPVAHFVGPLGRMLAATIRRQGIRTHRAYGPRSPKREEARPPHAGYARIKRE